MKNTAGIGDRIRSYTQLPGEPTPGKPLIELLDNRRILIENHRGMTIYSACEICVRIYDGEVSFYGDRLRVEQMTKDRLVICGILDHLQFRKRGGV